MLQFYNKIFKVKSQLTKISIILVLYSIFTRPSSDYLTQTENRFSFNVCKYIKSHCCMSICLIQRQIVEERATKCCFDGPTRCSFKMSVDVRRTKIQII